MAGLFGLFGKKDANEPKEAFFLESDTAKSLGNLDYMRTAKTIRRTFPKSKGSPEHKELIQAISATEKLTVKSSGDLPSDGSPKMSAPATTISDANVVAESRRQADSSMDMFREMAKGMKKG